MNDTQLIREAVKLSGLSARSFAESVTWRDERTIRRWNSGEQAIPELARRQLEWFLALTPTQRAALVNAATATPQR